jgi:transcriptional regulator with XRE-family HTH domain
LLRVTQPDDVTAEERFGAYVREVREGRGWTQEQLRRQLNDQFSVDLSSTAMARLEQGKRPIRLNEVTALAKLLGLDLQQYGGTIPRLTKDEYQDALRRLEEIRKREAAAGDKLASLRRARDEDLSRAELDDAILFNQRLQLEDAIREYEQRTADG